MLRVYFLQQWYGLADEALEDVLYDSQALQHFAGIELDTGGVTAANVADITQTSELLHGAEKQVHADAGYTGVEKRSKPSRKPKPQYGRLWNIPFTS